MARGEHQQISSAEVIAAARATIVAPPSPRITIPMPSIRAVKKAAWWTLGIVLFFCALPFIVLGLFEWGMFVADQFYVRHTPDHVALSFGVTFGTWFGVKVLVIAWLWRRDRRRIGATARCRAELAAKTTMAERNPLSGLLRENATHWHVVLAVVRFGVVAAFVVESLIFRAAHYSDHPKDLLTAWTPCLLLAVGLAFMSDWSWAIIKAFLWP